MKALDVQQRKLVATGEAQPRLTGTDVSTRLLRAVNVMRLPLLSIVLESPPPRR